MCASVVSGWGLERQSLSFGFRPECFPKKFPRSTMWFPHLLRPVPSSGVFVWSIYHFCLFWCIRCLDGIFRVPHSFVWIVRCKLALYRLKHFENCAVGQTLAKMLELTLLLKPIFLLFSLDRNIQYCHRKPIWNCCKWNWAYKRT